MVFLVKIEGTLEELRDLFLKGAERELKKEAEKQGEKIIKRVKKRAKTAWDRFLKSFKFRSRRKNESPSDYLSARSKAAGRAYRKKNKGRKK